MEFLHRIKVIQGGMGVYVSNWRLAREVALQRSGVSAGTVSGTGLDWVYVRLLQLGDAGGHVLRAFQAFDRQFNVTIGKKFYDKYFVEGGKEPAVRFKNPPQQIVHAMDGSNKIPMPSSVDERVKLSVDPEIIELLILAGFAEVWLAKEGHSGCIFINFLKKIELPLLITLYGAMLAGVNGVIVGAGNPDGLSALRTKLAHHEPVSIEIAVLYREPGEGFEIVFNPHHVAGGKLTQQPLKTPAFLAIASLQNLVSSLAQSSSEPPDGFIIEHHTAGGHNASPQGPLILDVDKQPQYSHLDEPDLEEIREIGIPFWLAGGYGSRSRLAEAISSGATGIQTGSIFAMAEESGMDPSIRAAFLRKLKSEPDDSKLVRTTMMSPTGFPFKVVQLEGTLSEDSIYQQRTRICDIGLLQMRGLSKPDEHGMRTLFQRCPAAPVEVFSSKRGLPHNTTDRRCLCNGLLAAVGLGQSLPNAKTLNEEPAILTLGNHIEGIRRLSRNGQVRYWVRDVLSDLLGHAAEPE